MSSCKLMSSILTSLLVFFALIPNYASSSITFNFTNITPQDSNNIIFSGDADYTPDEGIRVTHKDASLLSGRATYIKPLHLWDKESSELVSFTTSFTFVIDSNGSYYYADGLTFFLAQNNSEIKSEGAIGLPFDVSTDTSISPFVAVEFDTNGLDQWDPIDPNTYKLGGEHVGINSNSIKSVASRKWYSNIPQGKECEALINYDSHSNNLSVSFTNFIDNSLVWENGLHYTIDLRHILPEWVIFGFSASTGFLVEKNSVRSWIFNSTKLKVDGTHALPPTISPSDAKGKHNRLWKVELGSGTVVLVIVLAIVLAFVLRRMKRNKGEKVEEHRLALEMNNEFELGASMPRRFSYHELARSTANFAETKKLGEGGFGGVYKGFLKDMNLYVAIKRVSKNSKQGIKEYVSEVRIISRLRHRNLVQLTGWCHEKGELLLVYEFMENGSLDLHLFKGKSLLTWDKRYKIVHGLASALLYLREEWKQCVLHRDIKSSNIMLDSNFNAKLGDFGLAKLVDHEKGSQTTLLAGTLGYMAPECVVSGRATKESDVYSFGVVALEIASGRKVIDYVSQEKQIRLLEWVWKLYGKGALLKAVDPSLGSEFEEEEMKRLMIIGLWCVHPDSELRPSIREAIKVLNSEAALPLLPSKMPVASYLTPPLVSLSDGNRETSKQTTTSTNSSSSEPHIK